MGRQQVLCHPGQIRAREGTGAIPIMSSSTQAGIIYYSQEKYFHHVQQAAAVGLEKFSNDPVLQFFKAYGVLREGKDLAAWQSNPGSRPALIVWLDLDAYLDPSNLPMETDLH